jgi:hypothetical protein
MAIFLDTTLAEVLRNKLQASLDNGVTHPVCAEYGRYTAKTNGNGTFTVWAWVDNAARKIGEQQL